MITETTPQDRAVDARCLDSCEFDSCEGDVQYRMALSPSGKHFPRCDKHWAERLDTQRGIDARYPAMQPSDFDPGYAGESWYED